MNGSGAAQSNQKGTNRGTADAAKSTNHDHGKGQNDDFNPDTRHNRDGRCGQRTGKCTKDGTDDKGDGEHEADINAHRHRDLAVMDHRAQYLAGIGAFEQSPQNKANDGRNPDQ